MLEAFSGKVCILRSRGRCLNRTAASRSQTWLETSAVKSNMKYFLVVLLALCAISSAEVSPKFKELFLKALESCNKEAKLDKGVIDKLVKEEEIPANDNEKCYAACVLKEVGVIADGHFVTEEAMKHNKERYTGDNIIKADGVVQKCAGSIPKDVKGDCELAFQIMKCKRDEKKAVNLPVPNKRLRQPLLRLFVSPIADARFGHRVLHFALQIRGRNP
ncbi:hypothetical protein AAG570_008569 [Ranatra chinensis]|uniref:Uncharacterized protein n=1 Tax=Ranatra chinensis TaxID=642074 RepID=A0ABD0YRD9_9HEMI